MSVTLAIRFLAGQFHATPWNHQVNEGVVEWPPASWRLLRTLVAVAHRMPEPPQRALLGGLVAKLATALPAYQLPPTQSAHTRHYMPLVSEGEWTTTQVLDTFRVMAKGAAMHVCWPELVLDATERSLLAQLCERVNYLGRAESWAEMKLLEEAVGEYHAVPRERAPESSDGDTIEVLAPLTPEGMEGFQAAVEAMPRPKGKKRKWRVPTDVLSALEVDVGELHAQGWSGVPGARWVSYSVAEPAPRRSPASRHAVKVAPNFARYALAANVLPSLKEAVSLGERFRTSLMSRSDGAFVFAGREANGEKSQSNHRHAWYLPEDTDGDGRIDHVAVYAAQGFCHETERRALQHLSQVWGREGFDIQTVLVALGQAHDYGANLSAPGATEGRSPAVGTSRLWQSLTPVVLPRHPKKRRGVWVETPEAQVRRMLAQLGKDEPVAVRPIEHGKAVGHYPWYAFQRDRSQGHGSQGPRRGYGFELAFERPQQGPIALGYAAHFGLGTFRPVAERT